MLEALNECWKDPGDETDNDPCPNTQCPNCPRSHRLTGNAFRTLRFAVVDLGQRNVGMLSQATPGGGPFPHSNLSNVQMEGRQPRRTLLSKIDNAPTKSWGVQSAQAKKTATGAER